jgi:hypothetical protein
MSPTLYIITPNILFVFFSFVLCIKCIMRIVWSYHHLQKNLSCKFWFDLYLFINPFFTWSSNQAVSIFSRTTHFKKDLHDKIYGDIFRTSQKWIIQVEKLGAPPIKLGHGGTDSLQINLQPIHITNKTYPDYNRCCLLLCTHS